MCPSIDAQADGILDVADGHRPAAQATWDRLTDADLSAVRTKRDLIARVRDRYGLTHEVAEMDVEAWASNKRFGTWTF
jgi:hypothetical protein